MIRKISDRLEMNIELGYRLVQYSFPTYLVLVFRIIKGTNTPKTVQHQVILLKISYIFLINKPIAPTN